MAGETVLPLPVATGPFISHSNRLSSLRPLPNSCSAHSLNLPNHVKYPLSVPLFALIFSLFSPIRPSAPPDVSETLYSFCLRITSSVHFILVIRIIPFIDQYHSAIPVYNPIKSCTHWPLSLNLDIGFSTPLSWISRFTGGQVVIPPGITFP